MHIVELESLDFDQEGPSMELSSPEMLSLGNRSMPLNAFLVRKTDEKVFTLVKGIGSPLPSNPGFDDYHEH